MKKTRIKKYGSWNGFRSRGPWKAGWREIGGKKIYFRSRWEANYGYYLEFLKQCGEVIEWKHEPETFWFHKIKRGCRSYLPDFKVLWKEGKTEYVEVKGWMDQRSRTTIKRMALYYPQTLLRVVGAKWFKENYRRMSAIVPGWETDARLKRM